MGQGVQQLPLLYNPGPNLTVDNCLVVFRGCCPFRQYIPSKPAKYGIQISAACNAKSSYAWHIPVYTGKAPGEAPVNRAWGWYWTWLMEHNILCDHFCYIIYPGRGTAKNEVNLVGDSQKNKPELPSSVFAFTDRATVISYCPKKEKNVLLMSTMHKDTVLSTREDRKPQIVLDYNGTKGGVDNLDKVTATYRHITARWTLFFLTPLMWVLK